ncbi:major facilitator superfamily domain-containing protein [Aspergillus floccosus]
MASDIGKCNPRQAPECYKVDQQLCESEHIEVKVEVEDGVQPGWFDEGNPLSWSKWKKFYVLSPAMLNPAFVAVAEDLHITVKEASYSLTIFVLFSGVYPLFLSPFCNTYGRRPLFLIFTAISVAGSIASAASPSWGGLVAGRVFTGVGFSVPLGIGAAIICDLFAQSERGLPMGIYAWATTNGPHVSPIIGGYVAGRHGWRWCIWLPAIITGALLIVALFTFPETLPPLRETGERIKQRSLVKRLFWSGKSQGRQIRGADFVRPLRLLKYAAITLPILMYSVNLTYGSPLFAVTGSAICARYYGFNLEQTGLFLGLPLTIGCIIGELFAGWVGDLISNVYAKRHHGHRKPETRLYLLPLVSLTPVGIATFGYCIQERTPWIMAAVCMAVAGFGSEIATTVTYTYCCDSYLPEASEVGVVVNFIKSLFAFNIGFYALPSADAMGYTGAFSLFGGISATTLIILGVLIFHGESIRQRQGSPRNESQ